MPIVAVEFSSQQPQMAPRHCSPCSWRLRELKVLEKNTPAGLSRRVWGLN